MRWFRSTLKSQEPLKINSANTIHQVPMKGTWSNGF